MEIALTSQKSVSLPLTLSTSLSRALACLGGPGKDSLATGAAEGKAFSSPYRDQAAWQDHPTVESSVGKGDSITLN
jgi:hypothetical protein